MRLQLPAAVTAVSMALATLALSVKAHAQDPPRRLAVKNGETIDIGSVYWVAACRSILLSPPEVEVLEGPPEVTLGIRQEPVLPRRQGCAAKVDGGTLTLTAKGVKEETEAKLVYRLKYKTRDGDRQGSNTSIVTLYL